MSALGLPHQPAGVEEVLHAHPWLPLPSRLYHVVQDAVELVGGVVIKERDVDLFLVIGGDRDTEGVVVSAFLFLVAGSVGRRWFTHPPVSASRKLRLKIGSSEMLAPCSWMMCSRRSLMKASSRSLRSVSRARHPREENRRYR